MKLQRQVKNPKLNNSTRVVPGIGFSIQLKVCVRGSQFPLSGIRIEPGNRIWRNQVVLLSVGIQFGY